MGNSHNGCKSNETKFKAIIKTELLKLFFKTKREREKVDYYNCYFKKKYLKKMIIIIEMKAWKMLKAPKIDNKNWKKKTRYFVK